MHKNLQIQISNCTSMIEYHKSQHTRINNKNLFEDVFIIDLIELYWKNIMEINSKLENPISKNDFINEIKKDFPEIVEENETYIQSYFLEPWIYNSQKIYEEKDLKNIKAIYALRG